MFLLSIYNADVFSNRFGSINKLRQLSGYPITFHKNERYTEAQIKQMLLDLYTKLGHIPTREEL